MIKRRLLESQHWSGHTGAARVTNPACHSGAGFSLNIPPVSTQWPLASSSVHVDPGAFSMELFPETSQSTGWNPTASRNANFGIGGIAIVHQSRHAAISTDFFPTFPVWRLKFVQRAAQRFQLAFVVELLVLSQFHQPQDFFHLRQRMFQRFDNLPDFVNGPPDDRPFRFRGARGGRRRCGNPGGNPGGNGGGNRSGYWSRDRCGNRGRNWRVCRLMNRRLCSML